MAPRRIRCLSRSTLALALILTAAIARAGIVIEEIAREGAPAPGFPAGVVHNNIVFGQASLNDLGQVSHMGSVAGPGINGLTDGVLYRDTTIVARDGDAIPAVPGTVYGSASFNNAGSSHPAMNDAGHIAFVAIPTPGTLTHLFVDGTSFVIREGDPAPGLPAGPTILTLSPDPRIDGAGDVLWSTQLTNATTAVDTAIYLGSGLIAREGDAAPAAAGALFGDLRAGTPNTARIALSKTGHVAFYAPLTGSGVTVSNDTAIFAGASLVIREGDTPAGAPGAILTLNLRPQVNASGQVAWAAAFAGSITAVYRDSTQLAMTGDIAPGTGGAQISGLGGAGGSSPSDVVLPIDDAGEVVFAAGLNGAGVTSSNNLALYRGATLIARKGDQAPGLPAGVVYASFATTGATDVPAIDAAGRVAFRAGLSGAGVTSANDTALFFWDGATTELIAAEGAALAPNGQVVEGAIPLDIERMNAEGQLLFYASTNDGVQLRFGDYLASPDGDSDGVADFEDNCLYVANTTQSDAGGVGPGSLPDGIGDACQCGDVNDDGFVTGLDGTLVLRAALSLAPFTGGVSTLPSPVKCDVNGGATGDPVYHCSGLDGTLIQRASLQLPPGVQQVCTAALP